MFVNHEAVAWPARIEDPSCVQEMVTRHQYAVFLYGIHERFVSFVCPDRIMFNDEEILLYASRRYHAYRFSR